jgi:NAD(P)-dependent dehydrogenase (short-subunit alcohol dehydrogenase family)
MQLHLKDKVAWITGGGSGIGEATARCFAAEGAKIAITDVVSDSLDRVAGGIGGDVFTAVADVTHKADVDRSVKGILDQFGRLDILICSAGINRDGLALKMPEENWDAVLDVNLKGTFLCCQAAMRPMMDARSGRIVTTASVGALGNIGQANYAASKAGVIGLTKTLALELARFNVTVNCVAPGATDTPMLQSVSENVREGMIKVIPMRRFAHPAEIAAAHLFFCSEDAAYVTGQVLFVDGGLTTGI